MQYVSLDQLIQLQNEPAGDTAFVINLAKSTFIHVEKDIVYPANDIEYYASPTPLCGDGAQQYNPCFVMAVLSITPLLDIELIPKIQLPKVLFDTHPNIRRSMTLNAMRMSTELFAIGSERVYQLAQQRLDANQPDVVHDLLVYLMHAILDARREYAQETALRADSIAAYLGIDPAKVLLLMHDLAEDESALAESLERGNAGKLQRELNVAALVRNQIELLAPYQQSAIAKETQVIEMIRRVFELWKISMK